MRLTVRELRCLIREAIVDDGYHSGDFSRADLRTMRPYMEELLVGHPQTRGSSSSVGAVNRRGEPWTPRMYDGLTARLRVLAGSSDDRKVARTAAVWLSRLEDWGRPVGG